MAMTLPTISPGSFLTPMVAWMNIHWHPGFAVISQFIDWLYNGLAAILLFPPPYVLIGIVAIAAFFFLNRRVTIIVLLTLGFCWGVNMWTESIETIALVIISVSAAVCIAFPVGVLCARSRRIENVLKPILDIMQTVPPWVYLIPVVIFFSLGAVPSVIATVVYSAPPMVRLTTLGFKQVPVEMQELGLALGASSRTILFKIEVPAAKPTLLVGLNQCILFSLAMVVLAGLVGSGGLGGAVTHALSTVQMGLGIRSGLGVVAVAILLDRLSRAALDRPPNRTMGS